MKRRSFVGGLMAGGFVGVGAQELQVDGAGLQRSIEALSEIGRPAGGTFQSGVSRIGYTDADVAGRAL